MTNSKQPVTVSVVAILLLIAAGFSLMWVVTIITSPVMNELLVERARSVPVMILMALVNCGLSLACAIGILRGRNWARFLYIGYMPILILISAVNEFQISMLVGILQYIITVIILLLPASNRYFAEQSNDHNNRRFI